MGDVALTVPAIRRVIDNNPGLHITLVSSPRFVTFFDNIPRLEVFPADFYKDYKGPGGLLKLYRQLKKLHRFVSLIDLHGVIRSHILTSLFKLSGLKVHMINKDRKQKKDYIKGISRKKLTHSTDRYLEVFRKAGLKTGAKGNVDPVADSKNAKEQYKGFSISGNSSLLDKKILSWNIAGDTNTWIGIAPMAKHSLKRWDLSNFADLMNLINKEHKAWFFYFGGGENEKTAINKLLSNVENSTNITGRLSLKQEIQLISKLKFMISMDSANMHISALAGTPTISIWGGTHPDLGFSALNQPAEYSIQIPQSELSCRPCTVYGKGECARGDLACLQWIKPEMVYEKIKSLKLL